jgi:hypothetical protein
MNESARNKEARRKTHSAPESIVTKPLLKRS